MSEFSKLSTRLDCVLVELSAIDSAYGGNVVASIELCGEASFFAAANPRDLSTLEAPSSSQSSQSTNTLTSGTPGIRDQFAWRSNNLAFNTDIDIYASVAGVEALAHYDSVVRIQAEIRTKLAPACEQFILKSKTKDYVTDLPRYGTAMTAKIVATSEKSNFCLNLCTILVEKLGQIVKNENALKMQRKAEAEILALKKEEEEALLASMATNMVGIKNDC